MTRVLVVGASARAAVHSLARAGVSAVAIDLFGDRDLARVAECVVCPMANYPDALPALAARFPPGPLLYTGGLENYPRVVAELAQSREVWGNPPDVLERVRDPLFLSACGFVSASVVPRNLPCPADGRWLRKPLKSGGGLGIRFARPGEPPSPLCYFQEFVDGVPMSALYCGTTLLGVTEQLIGEPWLHARDFAYCGNIGPVDAPAPEAVPGLSGVWGVDFMLADGVARVVEVNPRYTAAVEVIEYASGRAYVRPTPQPPPCREGEQNLSHLDDLDAARSVSPPSLQGGGWGVGLRVGKAVYYAPRALTFPRSGPWDADLAGAFDPWRLPEYADIPHPGTMIEAGSPVLSFFVQGSSPADVRGRLQSRAAELDLLFAEAHP